MKCIKNLIFVVMIAILSLSLVACKSDQNQLNGNKIENNVGSNVEDVTDITQGNQTSPEELVLDIFDAVDVVYTGINGHGQARVSIGEHSNKSIDISSYVSKILFDSSMDISIMLQESEWYDLFCVNIIGENENLSNGDVITLEIDLSEGLLERGENIEYTTSALGFKLERTTAKYTVSGLEDGVFIDAFELTKEYMEYKYGDGCGTLEFNIPDDFMYEIDGLYLTKAKVLDIFLGYCDNVLNLSYNNQLIAQIYLEADAKNGSLSEGMDVKLVANVKMQNGSACDVNYYLLPSKIAKVPELGKYIESKEDLSSQNIDEILEYANYFGTRDYGEGKYVIEGIYLGTVKPQAVLTGDTCYQQCKIEIVFSYNRLWDHGVSSLSVVSKGFYIDANGSLCFPTSESIGAWTGLLISHSSDDPNNISQFDKNYTYEKIY